MTEINAERLHSIVEPVWKLHPETRPGAGLGEFSYSSGYWWICGAPDYTDTLPALLCEAGMDRWLAVSNLFPQVDRTWDGWCVRALACGGDVYHHGPTLIEAFAAACLAVPND